MESLKRGALTLAGGVLLALLLAGLVVLPSLLSDPDPAEPGGSKALRLGEAERRAAGVRR